MTDRKIIYDNQTGEVKAVGNAAPVDGEETAEIDDAEIPDEITGTRVDDVDNPSRILRDGSLEQPEEKQRHRKAKEWARQKVIERELRRASDEELPDGISSQDASNSADRIGGDG